MFCPKCRPSIALTDRPGLLAWIGWQVIIPYSEIEDSGKGIMNTQHGILAVALFTDQAVLPCPDSRWGYLVYRDFPEGRQQCIIAVAFIRFECGAFSPGPSIFKVKRYQGTKSHFRGALLFLQKIPLPFLGFALELKAPLLFLPSVTSIVRIIAFHVVSTALIIFVDRHISSSFHSGRAGMA